METAARPLAFVKMVRFWPEIFDSLGVITSGLVVSKSLMVPFGRVVCDEDWDLLDATVACRQLGFVSARRAISGLQVEQGGISRSRVDCVGDESRLSECTFSPNLDGGPVGLGAGVECSNTRVAPGTDSIDVKRGFESIEGGFEAGTSDLYLFNADGPSSVSIAVSDGEGGCPGDTVMTLVSRGSRWFCR